MEKCGTFECSRSVKFAVSDRHATLVTAKSATSKRTSGIKDVLSRVEMPIIPAPEANGTNPRSLKLISSVVLIFVHTSL